MDDHPELRSYLRALRRHLYWQQTLVVFAASAAVAAVVAAVVVFLGIGGASFEIAGLMVVSTCGVAVARRPTLRRAARATDREAALENRLATAVEILEGTMHGELAQLQLADAWRACGTLAPRRVFPILNRSFRIAFASAVIAGVLAGVAIRNTDALRAWYEGVLAAAVRADIDAPPVAGAPVIPLDSTANATPNLPGDETSALTSARLRDQLQQQDTQSRAFELAAAKLAGALKDTAAAQDVGVSLERGDYDRAATQLRDLARESDQLSAGARAELARALLQTSKDSAILDQQLAVAEQAAARALGRLDYDGGRLALENLAGVLTSQQAASIPSQEVARTLQQLAERDIIQTANAVSCGGGGDEYAAGPIDCSGGGLYSTGAMRSMAQVSEAASPSAANGEVGRGGGYATGGGSATPLGDTVTRLDAPADNVVQVDLSPSSARGRGSQADPKATTTVISQTAQTDVVLNGIPQPGQPITDAAESTVVSPGQNQVVRDFFQVTRPPR